MQYRSCDKESSLWWHRYAGNERSLRCNRSAGKERSLRCNRSARLREICWDAVDWVEETALDLLVRSVWVPTDVLGRSTPSASAGLSYFFFSHLTTLYQQELPGNNNDQIILVYYNMHSTCSFCWCPHFNVHGSSLPERLSIMSRPATTRVHDNKLYKGLDFSLFPLINNSSLVMLTFVLLRTLLCTHCC